jgi:hypothetical protein
MTKRKIDLANPSSADGRLAMRRLEALYLELRSSGERDAVRLAITALEAWTIDRETNDQEGLT